MYNTYCIDFLGAVQPLRIQVTRPLPRVRRGAIVLTPDGRMGFVQFIRVSPYYVEEKQGIQRAYIYSLPDDLSGSWTDYVLLDGLRVIE